MIYDGCLTFFIQIAGPPRTSLISCCASYKYSGGVRLKRLTLLKLLYTDLLLWDCPTVFGEKITMSQLDQHGVSQFGEKQHVVGFSGKIEGVVWRGEVP